jgi:ABC-2 type transport system ATP-binding protein
MTPVIELSGLTVRLGGRTVLDDLSGSFSGRALGLLGPNGAGKSTLLNALLGFYAPSAGAARIFGLDPQKCGNAVRTLIGYMPENDAFIASMTGVRSVRDMAELSGLPPREALERAHEIFVYVGLGEARYRKLGTYSIGMKQTAKLAQAMVHGPKLLFLDEPTNGLDPAARQRMIRLIQEVRDAGDTRLVISSHLLHDVEQCCDEVLILKAGRIAAHVNLEQERQSNQRFLELETTGGNGDFSRAAIALGCECATFPSPGNGVRVRVVLPENVEVPTLYDLAARYDVLIRCMNYRRDSLEEIFLDAMRDNDANGSATTAGRAGGTTSVQGAGDDGP